MRPSYNERDEKVGWVSEDKNYATGVVGESARVKWVVGESARVKWAVGESARVKWAVGESARVKWAVGESARVKPGLHVQYRLTHTSPALAHITTPMAVTQR